MVTTSAYPSYWYHAVGPINITQSTFIWVDMWLCLPDVWLLPFLKGHKYMWYKNISNETQINFEHDQVIYITGMLWWHVVHDHQNTVPMVATVLLTMTSKTLYQWLTLCQCWPWPSNTVPMTTHWVIVDHGQHCAHLAHDHQNALPMMFTVPMLVFVTKSLCQWWPM